MRTYEKHVRYTGGMTDTAEEQATHPEPPPIELNFLDPLVTEQLAKMAEHYEESAVQWAQLGELEIAVACGNLAAVIRVRQSKLTGVPAQILFGKAP